MMKTKEADYVDGFFYSLADIIFVVENEIAALEKSQFKCRSMNNALKYRDRIAELEECIGALKILMKNQST